jgi:hypothetical protein
MLLKRLANPAQTLISLGLFSLAAGSIAGWILRRNAPLTPFWDGFGDGLFGLLYGVAIALLLLGIRLRARERNAANSR